MDYTKTEYTENNQVLFTFLWNNIPKYFFTTYRKL